MLPTPDTASPTAPVPGNGAVFLCPLHGDGAES